LALKNPMVKNSKNINLMELPLFLNFTIILDGL